LEGGGREGYGDLPEFGKMVIKHKHVHELIKQAKELLCSGQTEALQSIAAELKEVRNDVLDSLNQLRNEANRTN